MAAFAARNQDPPATWSPANSCDTLNLGPIAWGDLSHSPCYVARPKEVTVTRLAQIGSKARQYAKQYRAGLLISGTVCVISLSLYVAVYWVAHPNPLLQFLHNLELKTLDMRFQLRGEVEPGPPVVIVAIDQKSQDVLGRWPFPRSSFAEAVDALREAGARVIAFDVDFPQPDQNSALQALQQVRKDYEARTKAGIGDPAFESRLKALEADADNDQKLADALSRFENAILGYFYLRGAEARTQNQERLNEFLNYLSFQAYPKIVHPEYAKESEVLNNPALKFDGLSPNLPQFALNAKNFGYFNIIPDPDGTVRREPVIIPFRGSFYPSLDVAAALAYTNLSLDQVNVVFNRNGLERIDFGKVSIPTDPGGFVWINYYGPARTFDQYSLADVVQRKIPAERLRDRLVLIGPTAVGIGDMAVTPFQQMNFFGVEVHANFITNILQGRFIRRGIRENIIDILFLLFFSLVAGMVLSKVPPSRATAIMLAFLGIFLGLAYYLFAYGRIWIVAFLPSATLTVNYAGIISYRFFFEEREKRKVRGAFHQYVPPGLITQILQHPELLRLGGEEKELTALFSDIRGFTTLSEGLTPTTLVDLLNEYLSEMTDVIFRHWGTLDKYIGDAIMAFWGAPYPQPDHALRACQAGLEMLQVLNRLQERWEAEGRPRIDIGVGINTGPMVVGNMGSKRRFNFTVMGDNVNLASRLEGINKQFGTRLIISEATYEAVREHLVARELDLIRVKGKMKPVRIFELLGPIAEQERFGDQIERFHKGLEAYRSSQWETAIETFQELTFEYPGDGPSHVFLKRCHDLLAGPPEGAWDGVYVMKTK
jgi:adenylate cyclase